MTVQQIMDTLTLDGVYKWRRDRAEICAAKARRFPCNSAVYVNSTRYKGFGTVARQSLEYPDRLGVRLENGNIWLYPFEDCKPAQMSELSSGDRRALLNAHGIKCAGRVFGPIRKLP